jgi:hypothetical protein
VKKNNTAAPLSTPSDQRLQITGAHALIRIDRNDGIVHFISLKSPEQAAAALWHSDVKRAELPHLRSSSDLAWYVLLPFLITNNHIHDLYPGTH